MAGNSNGSVEKLEFLAIQIFSNELIWRTLGPYLNPSDLKCCRLVNRKFNRMVMDETDFRNKVVLKVKKEKLKPEEFGKTVENWNQISLKFPAVKASSPGNYNWLFPLLTEVNVLSLKLQERVPGRKIDVHPTFGKLLLLSTCTKLKSLALEPDFIRFGRGGSFDGNETLKKLEQLEILEPNYSWSHFKGPFSDSISQEESEYRAMKEFCDSLKGVKIYKSCFVTKSPFIDQNEDFPDIEEYTKSHFLRHLCDRIISSNREHLESHPFYDIFQFDTEEHFMLDPESHRDRYNAEYHQTPALQCLQARSSQLYANIVNYFHGNWSFVDYLTSRPPLVQLEVFYPTDNAANVLLWRTFVKALAKHVPTLKKLTLKAIFFQGFDWSPMRYSKLTDLRLEDMRHVIVNDDDELEEFPENNDWIRQLIRNLPETVRRIYLKGAAGMKATKKLKVQDFSQFDPKLVDQLTIFNSGGSVTNEVVRFICSNFKMLSKLNLSNCRTDDRGFGGIFELKGLQYLTLRHCRISNKTLTEAIRFKELRYLDVSGNRRTTLPCIRMAMKQCPSLETLVVSGRKPNFTEEIQILGPDRHNGNRQGVNYFRSETQIKCIGLGTIVPPNVVLAVFRFSCPFGNYNK